MKRYLILIILAANLEITYYSLSEEAMEENTIDNSDLEESIYAQDIDPSKFMED